jgi:hypothetical protein
MGLLEWRHHRISRIRGGERGAAVIMPVIAAIRLISVGPFPESPDATIRQRNIHESTLLLISNVYGV